MTDLHFTLIEDIEAFTGRCNEDHTPVVFSGWCTLIWLTKGTCTLRSGQQRADVGLHSVHIVKPGQPIHATLTSPASGYVICFDPGCSVAYDSHLAKLFNHLFFNRQLTTYCIPVSDEDGVFLNAIAARMLTESLHTFDLKAEILKRLLKLLIIRVCRCFEGQQYAYTTGKKAALAEKFHHLLDKHFATKRKVREYADMLHVKANYLNCVIRDVSGHPASYHIHQRVIMEAKRQVVEEQSSMKEIAYRLGFPDQSHFSKYFRKNYGKRFTDFRKEIG